VLRVAYRRGIVVLVAEACGRGDCGGVTGLLSANEHQLNQRDIHP
jgi:hypothetical protein